MKFHISFKEDKHGPYLETKEFMMKSMKSDVSNFIPNVYHTSSFNNNNYEKPIRLSSDELFIIDYEIFTVIKTH
ncbi:hypothetical protein Glove_707g68 [Diversispora epigaea]|uniref:TLDc domain-containing protein n=1 Tax=Diversispora epigaea TaxID=1348612 RepID=A0A397GA29_9GLOM|nr:hypothetical protein Glove_707g68 [Diversispora epigaea]